MPKHRVDVALCSWPLGRGHNTWESPLGCLMFTVKCVVDKAIMLPFVQYLVSVAMVEAIKGERGCEVSMLVATRELLRAWL